MRIDRKHERKKRFKRSILSVTMYVGLIAGASILGISIVHFFFNPTAQPVVSEEGTQNQANEEETQNANEEDNEHVNNDTNSDEEGSDDTNNADEEADKPENNEENNSNNENGTWEPVGTTQEEPHITSYEEDSDDWSEMKRAFSVATEIDLSNLGVWWIGNDGGQNKSFGIVSNKTTSEYKRVSIVWVTNKGWKPTSVRNLTEEEYEKYVEPYITN
jgi:cytoskeletal protein RodZ